MFWRGFLGKRRIKPVQQKRAGGFRRLLNEFTMSMKNNKEHEKLEKAIGYTFAKKSLLQQALIHSSALAEKGLTTFCNSNERMEFLGDSILSVIVSRHLYRNLPQKPEGELTKLRANLICEEALYKYAIKLELGSLLIMSKGEENSGGRERKSILSDAFEALIAAVYLDSCERGVDALECAADFVVPFLPTKEALEGGKVKFHIGDYKTALQEIIQKDPNVVIEYEIVGEHGEAHCKTFEASVKIDDEITGIGSGSTKKEAEQQSAKAALIKLGADI